MLLLSLNRNRRAGHWERLSKLPEEVEPFLPYRARSPRRARQEPINFSSMVADQLAMLAMFFYRLGENPSVVVWLPNIDRRQQEIQKSSLSPCRGNQFQCNT
jgi:hypothetical protein